MAEEKMRSFVVAGCCFTLALYLAAFWITDEIRFQPVSFFHPNFKPVLKIENFDWDKVVDKKAFTELRHSSSFGEVQSVYDPALNISKWVDGRVSDSKCNWNEIKIVEQCLCICFHSKKDTSRIIKRSILQKKSFEDWALTRMDEYEQGIDWGFITFVGCLLVLTITTIVTMCRNYYHAKLKYDLDNTIILHRVRHRRVRNHRRRHGRQHARDIEILYAIICPSDDMDVAMLNYIFRGAIEDQEQRRI